MNKKFLSAILFGALMVTSTGTFVSCKDYDDDIENLQTQVDATKSDLSTKVSALESSISSLQSAQSSLDSKIAAAKEAALKAAAAAQAAATAAAEDAAAKAEAAAKAAAELAAAEAQAAAIAAAQEELAAAKAELVAAIDAVDAAHAADVEELEAAIAEAAEAANVKMAEMSGAIQTLQAFAVTTEEALEDLIAADKALQAGIAALDAKIAEQAVLVGKNTTAIAAQAEALENYKKAMEEYQLANDAAAKTAIAKIEGALAEMKAAADAQEKALADYIAANNAAVAGNAASIKANAEAIETLVADIKALQDGQLTEAKVNEIAAQVTKDLEGKLDLMSAIYNKMVTSVSLVTKLHANNWYTNESKFIDLELVSAKAVRTWTFGEGMPGAIEFEKGAKETFEKSFIIRVSPTNATVDEGTLTLVNSQLGNLNELVDIVSIKPYTGLLTRGISANGLWKVTVKLNEEYSEAAYETAAWTHKQNGDRDKQIAYAVMVADKDNAERQVVSEYGVTLGSEPLCSHQALDFNVNTTNVANIHNRWNGLDTNNSPAAVTEASGDIVSFLEKTWNMDTEDGEYVYAPWDVPTYKDNTSTPDFNEINVVNDNDDKRNAMPALSVKAGEAFTVNFNDIKCGDNNFVDHIRGFYVVLDEECAVESAPSEIRAWEAYDVEGLNEVSTTGSIELTIPEEAGAEGDYIGFRVFAVNYDGSLVDPDGKAFYVYVGETYKGVAELTLSISNKVVVPYVDVLTSTQDEFSTAKWARAKNGTYSLSIKGSDSSVPDVTYENFKFTYVNEDGDDVEVKLFDSSSNLINSDDITKVTKVELINVPATALKDGITYTATITAKNVNSGNVAIATVKFTKSLPAFPATIKPFTGQVVSGNLMVFPYYEEYLDGTKAAAYDMTSSWHGIDTYYNADDDKLNNVEYENFIHDVASNKKLSYNATTNILTAPIGYLKPTADTYLTKFPVKVTYNYGPISYRKVEEVWTMNQNWVTTWNQALTIQFGNYVEECEYSMDTDLKVTYPGAIGKEVYFDINKIVVEDWYGASVSLIDIMEQTPDTKEAKFFAEDFKVEFLTGADFDMVDEYFGFLKIADGVIGYDKDGNAITDKCIYMISKSDAATGRPVTTKVRLTFNDKFGNEIVKVVDGSFEMNYKK